MKIKHVHMFMNLHNKSMFDEGFRIVWIGVLIYVHVYMLVAVELLSSFIATGCYVLESSKVKG